MSRGRTERGADATVRALRAEGILGDRHALFAATLRGLARSVDEADDVKARTYACQTLMNALASSGLVPSKDDPADPLEDALVRLMAEADA